MNKDPQAAHSAGVTAGYNSMQANKARNINRCWRTPSPPAKSANVLLFVKIICRSLKGGPASGAASGWHFARFGPAETGNLAKAKQDFAYLPAEDGHRCAAGQTLGSSSRNEMNELIASVIALDARLTTRKESVIRIATSMIAALNVAASLTLIVLVTNASCSQRAF